MNRKERHTVSPMKRSTEKQQKILQSENKANTLALLNMEISEECIKQIS